MSTTNYGFDIVPAGGAFIVTRNSKNCTTALGKPVQYRSYKAAEGYVAKRIQQCIAEDTVSDQQRQGLRQEREARETREKAEQDAAFDARLKRERDIKEARRQRYVINDFLRSRGYKWSNLGFKNEEEADAFDINAPIGNDWQLFSADNRAVTVRQAMTELAAQNVKFAAEWLAAHSEVKR